MANRRPIYLPKPSSQRPKSRRPPDEQPHDQRGLRRRKSHHSPSLRLPRHQRVGPRPQHQRIHRTTPNLPRTRPPFSNREPPRRQSHRLLPRAALPRDHQNSQNLRHRRRNLGWTPKPSISTLAQLRIQPRRLIETRIPRSHRPHHQSLRPTRNDRHPRLLLLRTRRTPRQRISNL